MSFFKRHLNVIAPIIIALFCIAGLLSTCAITVSKAHENSGKTHTKESIGPCFGWKTVDSGQRICYLDKDKEVCKTVIYNHGQWHESEEYPCP